jgi:hypothetical protein
LLGYGIEDVGQFGPVSRKAEGINAYTLLMGKPFKNGHSKIQEDEKTKLR